ncbi:MAG: SH3 domain-containing protein [Nitrospinaceae bacterium]|nr:SH3 domain-containing protein [Nitrospinaceae bacterium]
MKNSQFGFKTLIILILLVSACAKAPSQFYESAPGRISMVDRKLFSKAMTHQKKGRIDSAIGLWEKFLKKHPDSFEARNNLGLLHYANDEITLAISQFEQGLKLEMGSPKIKDNLLRALKVRVAILEENKEYDSAITDLKKIGQLSSLGEQEKIERQVEGFEDKIFEQVKKSGLLEEYQGFLAKYPNSPRNSDEARLRIEELQQIGEMKETDPFSVIPESDLETEPPVMSESMVEEVVEEVVEESFAPEEIPSADSSFPEESIEIVEESVVSDNKPAPPAEVVPMAEPVVVEKPIPMVDPAPIVSPEPAPPPAPQMVQVVTKKGGPLNVRSEPEKKTGNIVYKLKNGAKTTFADENEGWYQVEYAKGKKGWISKKYSKLLE